MELKHIEDEIMHLPKSERAQLIRKLISSLDVPSKQELQDDWLTEAGRRAEELDQGVVQGISGDEVLIKARTLVK